VGTADPNAVSIVGTCPLFFDLSEAERVVVANEAQFRRFSEGTAIFQEHQQPQGLWVLGSGQVKLQHASANGREHIVAFPTPGSPLALWAVMDDGLLTETATSMGPVTALLIPRDVIRNLAVRNPGVGAAVVESLCDSLRVRDIGGGIRALRDARERIACRLLLLARQYASADEEGVLVRYPITRQDLANATGVALETAIRTLSGLKRAGLIDTVARMVDIRDVSGMETVAGCDQCLFDCSVFGAPINGHSVRSAALTR
jgi:CRP-like cAMP-binding protein